MKKDMESKKISDRHSKIMTSRGIRDRRVRLSVETALQFFAVQEKLGFEQPSKTVDWLIHNSRSAIESLPRVSSSASLTPFLVKPTQVAQLDFPVSENTQPCACTSCITDQNLMASKNGNKQMGNANYDFMAATENSVPGLPVCGTPWPDSLSMVGGNYESFMQYPESGGLFSHGMFPD